MGKRIECLICKEQGIICIQPSKNSNIKIVKIEGGREYIEPKRIYDCPILKLENEKH